MIPKPDFCNQCPINHLTEGYVPFQKADSLQLIVGEAAGTDEVQFGKPFVGGAGRWLGGLLKQAGQDKSRFNIINTIGCKPPDNIYPSSSEWKFTSSLDAKAAVEHCRLHHLQPALESKDWQKVIALGNYALKATTGRDGITVWRGSPLPLKDKYDRPRVIPTLHPAFLMRGSNLSPIVVNDLRKTFNLPPEKYKLYCTPEELKQFDYKSFVFDFEWDEWGNITLAGLCGKPYEVLVFAWVEPYISIAKKIFENATDLYGHNIIGADTVYFSTWNWDIKAYLWDTMLMQHLVQPDYRHSLGFVSSVFTNRVHWKGMGEEDVESEDEVERVPRAQWKTWARPDALPIRLGGYGGCQSDDEAFRLYNARDNAANYDIIQPLNYLLTRYNLMDVYKNVSRPAALLCRDMESVGMKVDQDRFQKMADNLDEEINRLELNLPPELRSFEEEYDKRVPAPPNTYKPKAKICKGKKAKNKKEIGTLHEPIEILFTEPNTIIHCPACETPIESPKLQVVKTVAGKGYRRKAPWNSSDQVIEYAKTQGLKLVYNPKTKQITADKSARKAWGKHETSFVTIDKLKKAATLRQTFAKESLRSVNRMFYRLKVHGTSEGRLACSGARKGIDINVQQAPKKFRKVFVPDKEGYCFLSFDVGQGENIITTWLAEDWERWERINTPGYDEHSDLAQRIFNCDCTKDGPNDALRQVGKKINHLKNYGGQAKKMWEVLIADGYNMYTLKDCKEFDQEWRKLNARTAKWQDETIELARVQGYLRNNFRRIRWFNTSDYAAKALAFLPASTLADCVLRMMIACHLSRFGKEIADLNIDCAIDLPKDWDLRIQIHDDLTFHGPHATLIECAEKVHYVMTQPWKELNGLRFKVDGKYSTESWGDMINLPNSL